MGLICSSPRVYKPAPEVDLGPGSDELYISPNVKGSFLSLPGPGWFDNVGVRALAVPGSDSCASVETFLFCFVFFSSSGSWASGEALRVGSGDAHRRPHRAVLPQER